MTQGGQPTGPPPREIVAAVHRTAMIIVAALGMSILLYAVVGLVILSRRFEYEQGQLPVAFIVVAIVLIIAPIWIRRTQLDEPHLLAVVLKHGMEGLVRHFFKITLISAGLADAIGLLGLLATLMGGGVSYLLIFAAAGLLVLLRSYPSRRVWLQAVDYFNTRAPGTV